MKIRISGLCKILTVIAISLFAQPSYAEPQSIQTVRIGPMLALAGADMSKHSSYVYVGGVAQLGHATGESGMLAKVWLDRLRYDYVAAGIQINANATGTQAAMGYQWVRPDGLTAVYFGIGTRDTSLPAGVVSAQSGRLTGAVMEIDLVREINKDTGFDGIVSYADKSREYWTRARILRKTAASLQWGPELVLQGSPNYSANRLGIALAGFPVGEKIRLGGNVGYSNTRGIGGGTYLGIDLARPF